MLKVLQSVNPLVLLLIATLLEVSGDAVIRVAIYKHPGPLRLGLFLAGAALLFAHCRALMPDHEARNVTTI